MTGNSGETFVGFGLGPIQTGLFLHEAQMSGAFGRLVVAETAPEAVRQVREARGFVAVNVAHRDGIESIRIGPIQVLDPERGRDRIALIGAIADAREIATAVPGVASYSGPGPGTVSSVLAEGLRRKALDGGPRAVVYAGENNNRAAEILEELVLSSIGPELRPAVRTKVRFVNTVIGKMCGTLTVPKEIQRMGLATMTPKSSRAFLVESFDRILISRIDFQDFTRCMANFTEKDDLLPFEEAKLYGHNATHALAAYIAAILEIEQMAALVNVPGVLDFLRSAFLGESGAALIRRYGGLDPLFTPGGYGQYVDDLLERIVNPFLADSAQRVARDPLRKLGWHDRLVGTVRLALQEGIRPVRFSLGIAAALACVEPAYLTTTMDPTEFLMTLWPERAGTRESGPVLELIRGALDRLRRWYALPNHEFRALVEWI